MNDGVERLPEPTGHEPAAVLPVAEFQWQERANCLGVDPDIFVPERRYGNHRENEMAKAICAVCQVQVECLDHAMQNKIKMGVWGGKTEWERRLMRWRGLISFSKPAA